MCREVKQSSSRQFCKLKRNWPKCVHSCQPIIKCPQSNQNGLLKNISQINSVTALLETLQDISFIFELRYKLLMITYQVPCSLALLTFPSTFLSAALSHCSLHTGLSAIHTWQACPCPGPWHCPCIFLEGSCLPHDLCPLRPPLKYNLSCPPPVWPGPPHPPAYLSSNLVLASNAPGQDVKSIASREQNSMKAYCLMTYRAFNVRHFQFRWNAVLTPNTGSMHIAV